MNTQPILPDLIRQILEHTPTTRPDGRASPSSDRCTARLLKLMRDGSPWSIQSIAKRLELTPKQVARAVRQLRGRGAVIDAPGAAPARAHPWSRLVVLNKEG